MKLAYRTSLIGITSIVAAETRAKAKAITLRCCIDAGYRAKFVGVRAVRAPEHDGWAAIDETRHCWEEKLLPQPRNAKG